MLVAPLGKKGEFCGYDALMTTAELHTGDEGVSSLCQGGLLWSEFSYRHPPVLVGSNCTALQEKVWAMMFPGLGATLLMVCKYSTEGTRVLHCGSACTCGTGPTCT